MSSKLEGLYKVRDYHHGTDKAFVMATFLRGLYYGESWFSLIPKNIFMDNYQKIAEKLISSDRVIIKIACLEDDEEIILGYSIMSADYQTLHWVFVKQVWRKQGIARALTPRHPITVTHLSDLGRKLLPEKFKGTIFNPFNL
jgi:hypothetical protein